MVITSRSLNFEMKIWTTPVEVEDRPPFEQDHHAAMMPTIRNSVGAFYRRADHMLTNFVPAQRQKPPLKEINLSRSAHGFTQYGSDDRLQS